MVHHSKPNTLTGLCGLTQAINAHYWEHHTELAHKTGNSRSSGNKSKQKSDCTRSDSRSSNGSSHMQNNNNSGSTQSNGSTSGLKEPTPNLSSKIGTDGKLIPQEHQCCLNNKLSSSAASLDTSPTIVQKPPQLPPKPEQPRLIRIIPCLPAQTPKRTKQSP